MPISVSLAIFCRVHHSHDAIKSGYFCISVRPGEANCVHRIPLDQSLCTRAASGPTCPLFERFTHEITALFIGPCAYSGRSPLLRFPFSDEAMDGNGTGNSGSLSSGHGIFGNGGGDDNGLFIQGMKSFDFGCDLD